MPNGEDAWMTVRRKIESGHGVAVHGRLLEVGVHRSTIRNKLNTGRLVPVFEGVYRLEGAALGEKGRLAAAAAQAGPGALVSHRSAMSLHGLIADRGHVEVLRTSGQQGPNRLRPSADGWKVRLWRTS